VGEVGVGDGGGRLRERGGEVKKGWEEGRGIVWMGGGGVDGRVCGGVGV